MAVKEEKNATSLSFVTINLAFFFVKYAARNEPDISTVWISRKILIRNVTHLSTTSESDIGIIFDESKKRKKKKNERYLNARNIIFLIFLYAEDKTTNPRGSLRTNYIPQLLAGGRT